MKNGSIIYSPNIISTIDVKVTMENLVGLDVLRSLQPRYARKIESTKMTTSSFTVNLGIDNADLLTKYRLPCGYALLTSGDDAFPRLYRAFENDEFALSEDCFYIGLSCPYPEDKVKPVLSLQAMPIPVGNWINLKSTDRVKYIRQKEEKADRLIGIVEKYLIPGLKKHIVVKDISTPATFARYSGSPTGSIYDMAAIPDNFGANRLSIITPIHGLLLPKFAHGVFGAMNSGLQAVDVLLGGTVMGGNSRFSKKMINGNNRAK